MGLTYATGANLLNYLYNDVDFYGVQRNQNDPIPRFSSFIVALTKSNGIVYSEGGQNESLIRGFGSTSWNINGNIVTNAIDLTFPPKSTSGSETITGFTLKIDGVSDSSSIFATGTLNTPITIQQGETPIIYAGDLEINIDQPNRYTSTFKQKIYEYLFLGADSLSSVNQYRFIIINTQGAQTPLEFYLTRDSSVPNFVITSEGGGSYAAARNASDIDFDLNQGVNISTNQIRMFYSQGTFPNFTYVYAGDFIMREIGTGTPTTYTIANGETARLRTNFLRINAQ